MFRGWDDAPKNPFDDDGDGDVKSRPPPNPFDDDDTESPLEEISLQSVPNEPLATNVDAAGPSISSYTPPPPAPPPPIGDAANVNVSVNVSTNTPSILDEAPPNTIPARMLNSTITSSPTDTTHTPRPAIISRADDTPMFREWEAANARYQQETTTKPAATIVVEEIAVGDDPLGSPGNSSTGGSVSGWSVAAGMVDGDGHSLNPFDDDDDDDDSSVNSGIMEGRNSSPRQGCCKRLGLSMAMVKEEDEEDDDVNGFDDVDLEASSPRNVSAHKNIGNLNGNGNGNNNSHKGNSIWNRLTSSSSSSSNGDNDKNNNGNGSVNGITRNSSGGSSSHKISSGIKSRFTGFRKASVTDRVLQEFQTNPNLKFRVIVALSMMLIVSCLLAVIVVTSTKGKNNSQPMQVVVTGGRDSLNDVALDIVSVDIGGGFNNTTNTTTIEPTGTPTEAPTTMVPTSKPTTKAPTPSPSRFPTYDPTSYPTNILTTANPSNPPTDSSPTFTPSFGPTTVTPTFSPSATPVTLTPTRNCNDEQGEFLTYSDKLRDCAWLDNGYNGAKSSRKDDNCIDSRLGDACKYTCRLYNGCIDYLLSGLPRYSDENDVSVGHSCMDKEGNYMSNGDVPRMCGWLEEDPNTAPAKKDLNCGTRDHERTELGNMCPGSCAGYNDCVSETGDGGVSDSDSVESDGIQLVSPHPLAGLPDNVMELIGYEDTTDAPTPQVTTPFPTAHYTSEPTTKEERCQDKEGEFRTKTGKIRECRWLNRDSDDESAVEKKLSNCGMTEIGENCMESCPCKWNEEDDDNDEVEAEMEATSEPTTREEKCQDKDGEFLTNTGNLRGCRWLNRDSGDESVAEKKLLNCGMTEIGENCMESCPCTWNDDGDEVEEEKKEKDVEDITSEDGGGTKDGSADETDVEDITSEDGGGSKDGSADETDVEDITSEDGGGTKDGSADDSSAETSVAGKVSLAIKSCEDKDGEFLNHDGKLRACRWLNKDDIEEKKKLNCGITEVGLNCLDSCPCDYKLEQRGESLATHYGETDVANDGGTTIITTADSPTSGSPTINPAVSPSTDAPTSDSPTVSPTDAPTSDSPTISPTDGPTSDSPTIIPTDAPTGYPTWSPTSTPTEPYPTQSPTWIPTMAPTVFPESKGFFADDSQEVLELLVLADAEVSQRYGDENFGDSKRLNVLHNDDEDGRDRQSLLLFDLKFVANEFGPTIGSAKLNLFCVTGSDLGGVTLKKMSYGDWTEYDVTWNNMPNEDGADEPVIAFLDTLDRDSWYEIDVTAAVKDALENEESHLGIRIVSDDEADVYFASKERVEEPPRLIIDSRTIPPSPEPSYKPTYMPTLSPTIELDCMDKEGEFLTHNEEHQTCSWLDAGNGQLKKAFNCQNPNMEAPMFCQASCSAYNGCDSDELHCTDMSGTYESHTGWTVECAWLMTGQGTLKLEQNCGTQRGSRDGGYPMTELGKRCQAACGEFNGCGIA